MGQKNCIYGICNKDGRAILYNEETNQFITSTKTVDIPQRLIRNVTLLLIPITTGISYFVNPTWMNLLNSNAFKMIITVFLFVYTYSAYVISKKSCNSFYKKHYFVITEKDFELTIDDIKNGENNLEGTCKLMIFLGGGLITLTVFVLFIMFKIFVLFIILLVTLFCSVILYALALPRKRKRFYDTDTGKSIYRIMRCIGNALFGKT